MPTETYTDLHGREHSLDGLTKPERAALQRLRKLAAGGPDWMAYTNQFVAEMDKLLPSTGKSRRAASLGRSVVASRQRRTGPRTARHRIDHSR